MITVGKLINYGTSSYLAVLRKQEKVAGEVDIPADAANVAWRLAITTTIMNLGYVNKTSEEKKRKL